MNKTNLIYYSLFAAICVLAYFAIFLHLDTLSLRYWDESCYALNAQAMIENKNPIVVYLNGQPDLYNTKPPFAIWCIAISMKIFGYNELGIRFPSALFSFLTVLLIFYSVYKFSENLSWAFFASLVLCASLGYVTFHVARTGDTDSILTFWIFAYVISFWKFWISETENKKNKWLLLTSLFVSMACLTKGMAGLTGVIGLFLFIVYSKNIKQLFSNKFLYFGILIFIILVPGYYLLREKLAPGYINAVFNNEIGGRIERQNFLNPENRSFLYYINRMIEIKNFSPWIFLIPLSFIFSITSFSEKAKPFFKFIFIVALGVVISISSSQTKLPWYDAPMYPFLAVIAASAFSISILKNKYLHAVIFFLYFYFPYSTIINQNLHSKFEHEYFNSFQQKIRNEKHITRHLYCINADPNLPMVFYIKQDNLKGNSSEMILPFAKNFNKGDLLITAKESRKKNIIETYLVDTLDQMNECFLFRVIEKKNINDVKNK